MIDLEVAVAVPLQQTLTYRFDPSSAADNSKVIPANLLGRRVLVPLGQRKVTGYILGNARDSGNASYTIRHISKLLDGVPLFHANIVSFYRWVADYYHYPLGLVIKAALPGGLAPQSRRQLITNKSPDQFCEVLNGDLPAWLTQLANKNELTAGESAKVLADPTQKKLIDLLIKNNYLAIKTSVQADGVKEKKELCYSLATMECFPHQRHDGNREELRGYRQQLNKKCGLPITLSEAKAFYHLNILAKQHNSQTIALKDIKKLYPGAGNALQMLAAKGLVVRTQERVLRNPFGRQHRHYPRPSELTGEQHAVLGQLRPAIRAKRFRTFLIYGVTGCGKTEVYLRAAEECLAVGRDILILVPEIALATQLEAHLLSRFGNLVVLLHSGLSRQERFDQFSLALSAEAKIVIGARSAIFAPLRDPGLIVVDEEHDSSYKQDDSFRYHARDLAVLRAKHHGSVVILGSATPSVTSYSHAKNGKYTLLTMKKRVGDSELPTVSIVDLNSRESRETKGIIKKELLDKLRTTLARKKQSVLLINRRGFSTVVLCQDCGTPVQCAHCHVALTLHKGKGLLICHYCGFSARDNTICAQCRSAKLVPAGFGTERVEEEVNELLPDARICRLDSDTVIDRKKFLSVLADMHDGKIDILIGTQMIAKGHHFPNVAQVGVVWADAGMSMPDFRAAERTFQLISQVTGRAGREETPGEVIIQTMRPDHYAIVFAKNHQYEKMYEREIQLRRHPAFPPFVRLVCLHLSGRVDAKVQQSAERLAIFCREWVKKAKLSVEALGPAPSPLDKIKDKYRWQVLLKGSSTDQLHDLCIAVKTKEKQLITHGNVLSIDIDPENMM